MLITQLLDMNKRNAKTIWLLLTAFLLLQSCKKNPASHPDSSLRDTGEEIYKEALTIGVDTSAATFEKLFIADADQKKVYNQILITITHKMEIKHVGCTKICLRGYLLSISAY